MKVVRSREQTKHADKMGETARDFRAYDYTTSLFPHVMKWGEGPGQIIWDSKFALEIRHSVVL